MEIGIARRDAMAARIAASPAIMARIWAGVAPTLLSTAISVWRWRTVRVMVVATENNTIIRPLRPTTAAMVIRFSRAWAETAGPRLTSIRDAKVITMAAPSSMLMNAARKAAARN